MHQFQQIDSSSINIYNNVDFLWNGHLETHSVNRNDIEIQNSSFHYNGIYLKIGAIL